VTREELVSAAALVLLNAMEQGQMETRIRAAEIALMYVKFFEPESVAPPNPDRAPMPMASGTVPAKHAGFAIG
jgi:hypothetical protein